MKIYKPFGLLNIEYKNDRLTFHLAAYVVGEPDGLIGLPLVIGKGSVMYTVTFDNVDTFRSTPEPCFTSDGTERNITDFLFECLDSEYLKHACLFGVGAPATHHFGIITELVIIEVLSQTEPSIYYNGDLDPEYWDK